MADDSDDLDGCSLNFADPTVVSTDTDVDALLMFADLPWTGEIEDGRPIVEPNALAQRISDLQELSDGGL